MAEIECQQTDFAGNLGLRWFPSETASDHQMEHEVERFLLAAGSRFVDKLSWKPDQDKHQQQGQQRALNDEGDPFRLKQPHATESTWIRSHNPCSSTYLRITPSAVGERQIFPMQTNKTCETFIRIPNKTPLKGRPDNTSDGYPIVPGIP